MRIISLFWIMLMMATTTSTAQRVFKIPTTDEVVIITDESRSNINTSANINTFDEYFGDHADVMMSVYQAAEERRPHDEFQWSKKVPGFIDKTNSCWDASSNLIEQLENTGVLPEGWKARQIGTLGTLTNAENAVGDTWDQVKWSVKRREFADRPDHDPLDPQSYAHSLTLIRAPDGTFYTVDNWMGGIEMKKLYSLDPDDTFFTTNPDETDHENAKYRRSRADGRKWDHEEKIAERDRQREADKPSPIPPTSEPIETEVLTSADPNDKLGKRGAGTEHFITPDGLMTYLIRFENMPEASAPAQEVLIADTLDSRVLDLSTFTLGDITFADTRVPVPPGLSSFSTRLPINGGRFELLISAGLVRQTGIATWRFITIDPQTNDLPFDPLDGFLPPNQTSPEGEGSVSFRINLVPELPHDTQIRNEARIIFDLNEPIDTPPWTNTLDLRSPTSSITGLEPSQRDSLFTVRWGGSDEGSGVRSYDIYVSTNDGPFLLWHSNTPGEDARFDGSLDSTYAFFSIATDAVGNVEPMKTHADAVTFVSIDGETGESGLPTSFALEQNYPNPFNPSTTIKYAVPRQGHIVLRIYDTLGRVVTTLINEDRAPGWYEVQFNAGHLASGVYFYQLSADDFTDTRKFILLK
jgi:hypothetical protein